MVSKRIFCILSRDGETQSFSGFLSGNPMFGNDYDKLKSSGIYLCQTRAEGQEDG